VLELLLKSLPILRNVNFSSTGEFERQHKDSKLARKGALNTIDLAMREDSTRDGLGTPSRPHSHHNTDRSAIIKHRPLVHNASHMASHACVLMIPIAGLAINGVGWGNNKIGWALSAGIHNEAVMAELSAAVAPLASTERNAAIQARRRKDLPASFDGWLPGVTVGVSNGLRTRCLAGVRVFANKHFQDDPGFVPIEEPEIAMGFYREAQRLDEYTNSMDSLCVGSDVELPAIDGESRDFACISAIFLASVRGKFFLLILPTRWTPLVPDVDPFTFGWRVQQAAEVPHTPAVQLSAVLEQVLVHHGCGDTCVAVCPDHGVGCEHDECMLNLSIQHDANNLTNHVFTEEDGFLPARPRV
jgi:hypothetical protein